MILDASHTYTDLEVSHAIKNPIVFNRYVSKDRNIYSELDLKVYNSPSSFSVVIEKRKLKSSPKKLKAAMFKLSSVAIARSLK